MRTITAYLAAVGAAGLCFSLRFVTPLAAHGPGQEAFLQWIEGLAVWFAFNFVVFDIVCVVVTLAPFMIVNEIAATFRLRSRVYFCSAGLLLGAAYSGPLAWVFSQIHGWYTDPPDYEPPGFMANLVLVGPVLVLAGLVGGFTYWALAGRRDRARRRTALQLALR